MRHPEGGQKGGDGRGGGDGHLDDTVVVQAGQSALVAQAPGTDDANSVGQLLDLGQGGRGDHDRYPLLAGEGHDELADLGHVDRVEPLGGLVQQQERRVRQERHGQSEPLLQAR